MIRIVHLITGFAIGGAEKNLASLVSLMDRKRFANTVVIMRDVPGLQAQIVAPGVPVYSLHMKKGRPDLMSTVRLARILRSTRPDVLQTWMYHADLLGLLAGKLTKVPSIIWNIRRTFADMKDHKGVSALVLRALVRLSSAPDAVLTNSLAGRESHEALGYKARRWVLIRNGTDTERFRPDSAARLELRRELNLASDTELVGLVARFVPVKGHDNFIAAASRLALSRPTVHFVLVGRDVYPHNQKLIGLVRSSGIAERIHLLGERAEVNRVTAGLDVACSASNSEGCSNTINEALASGVLCVATDVGDSGYLIGAAGQVVAPGDPEAFATACARILELGTDRRNEIGLRARRRVLQQFSMRSTINCYESLYEELALKRNTSHVGCPIEESSRESRQSRMAD
jgi:glycosyltransferase involved in cell wall biosynthesis